MRLWCGEITIDIHSFKVEKFMKERFWYFATKETQAEGPNAVDFKFSTARWLNPTQAAVTRKESNYFYALLFLPAVNEQ